MLELKQISKSFGSFTALSDFNFSVRGGEIVGLLGENGAGKSTAIGIIGGDLQPSSGEIWWRGERAAFASSRAAGASGIGVVHQHFRLVPGFSVAENLALQSQHEGVHFRARNWEKQVEIWAASLGWRVDARARIESLGVGEAQRVEILKALFAASHGERTAAQSNLSGAQILLLDEPTSNLTPAETRELFVLLRRLRDEGRALVFVSHKLDEVTAVCDRVVVLRRGELVGERAVSGTDKVELGALMVGRAVDEGFGRAKTSATLVGEAPKVLSIQSLQSGPLRDFSLSVRGGEIVALAGVDGNGQRELAEVLGGWSRPEAGTITVDGSALSPGSVAMIPPDRQKSGLILSFDLTENMALHPQLRAQCRTRFGFDWKQARSETRALMTRFDVRSPQKGERAVAVNLSGGNQQKLIVARTLGFAHRVVVAVDPTRGLDVGASAFVHQQLRSAAAKGAAVLLISTDLDEVLALGDWVGVLFEGRLLPDEKLLPAGTPRDLIGALMGGAI